MYSCRPGSALTYLSRTAGLPCVTSSGHRCRSLLLLLSPPRPPALAAAVGGPRSPGPCELGLTRVSLGSPRAARLPGGGASDAAAAAAAEVLMRLLWLWNSAAAPLSAQQLPGRGLRAAPAQRPRGRAVSTGKGIRCLRRESGTSGGRARACPPGSARLGALAPLLPSPGRGQTPAQRTARPRGPESAPRPPPAAPPSPRAPRSRRPPESVLGAGGCPAARRPALPARTHPGAGAPRSQRPPEAAPPVVGARSRPAARPPNPARPPGLWGAQAAAPGAHRPRSPPPALSMLRLRAGVATRLTDSSDPDAGERKGSFPDPRGRATTPHDWGRGAKLFRGAQRQPSGRLSNGFFTSSTVRSVPTSNQPIPCWSPASRWALGVQRCATLGP